MKDSTNNRRTTLRQECEIWEDMLDALCGLITTTTAGYTNKRYSVRRTRLENLAKYGDEVLGVKDGSNPLRDYLQLLRPQQDNEEDRGCYLLDREKDDKLTGDWHE